MVCMSSVTDCPSTTGFADLLRVRRSIRTFRSHAVPRVLVREILQEAVWAPSPHNSQPWRFTVLFELEDKECLSTAMASRLESELREEGVADAAIRRQTERSRVRIDTAPVAILCSLTEAGLARWPDRRRTDLEWQMAVQSVGTVMMALFLSAAARGVGSCWMAAPMYCPDEVRCALELPLGYKPQALVLLGYPADPGRQRERRPFEEVVDLR
jgi:coenzyme F420-0:L-glutamate ligase / coenzyme F420-1:gamma-L-glutamate ligase